jgi:hypothetical protein
MASPNAARQRNAPKINANRSAEGAIAAGKSRVVSRCGVRLYSSFPERVALFGIYWQMFPICYAVAARCGMIFHIRLAMKP